MFDVLFRHFGFDRYALHTTSGRSKQVERIFLVRLDSAAMEFSYHNNTAHTAAHLQVDTAVASMARCQRSNGSAPAATRTSNSDTITADQIEDVLARIVHRVDLQESHEGDGSTAERWNEDSQNAGNASNASSSGRNNSGPLTSRELSELSFLCSKIAATMTTSGSITGPSIGSNNKKNNSTSFANVEIDIVLSIIELLDRHVNLAVGINVIESSASIVRDTTKSPSQIAAALEQVCVKHAT